MALLRKLALLAALPALLAAPFALVGCAEEQPAPAAETDQDVGEATEDGTGSANDWQHQADANLSCSASVDAEFTKSSRRHYYSFGGTKGQATSFSLDGGWPASYGARAYVTDVAGKVIGTASNTKDNAVSVSVTFPSDGKYFVYVSPSNYKSIKKDYGYELTATCAAPAKPYCATVRLTKNVTSPTFYAHEFTSKALADKWLATFTTGEKQAAEGECAQRPCTKIYKPVCGTLKSGEPKTYGNSCEIESTIIADAGNASTNESKGFYTEGACVVAPVCDYDSPTRHYVVQSKEQCKLVKYRCSPGQVGFADDCGCGCEDSPLASSEPRSSAIPERSRSSAASLPFVAMAPERKPAGERADIPATAAM